MSMRTAIGLIGLGVVGGIVPTGLPGIPYALLVLAATLAAMLLLVAGCVVGATLARRSPPPVSSRPLVLKQAASIRSAPRTIS
jgi:hypothetical protein